MEIRIFVLLCVFATVANGYKILFLAPMFGKSHWLFSESLVKALLQRGHEVTCVTSFGLSGTKPANYTEVLLEEKMDVDSLRAPEEVFELSAGSPFQVIRDLSYFPKFFVDFSLSSKSVQKLIHRNDLEFDLIISEEFFHDAYLIFGYKYNAPTITYCGYGNSDFFDRQMGLLTPWSHVPHMALSYTDNMSFSQRWYNTIVSAYDWFCRRYKHLPGQNELIKKHFAHLEPLPSVDDLINNVSLILVNSHRSVSPPRPAMPGIINIGGAHIKKPKSLPSDIQTFLDGAKDGAIYFSFGTIVQSSKMPKDKLNIFLNTFGKLKQRVIWKFDDESLPNVPPNVMIRKWLPQSDILAHKNVILFIAHGGMYGNFESIARGVPMLIIPFFGDQHRNAERAKNAGYAKSILFKDITSESLLNTLQEVIADKKYYNRAQELSALYGDNLIDPMEEAMFWIEYVCRHKGAKHLKSHAVNMSWFSYLLLDIILPTMGVIAVVLFGFYTLLLKLCKKSKPVISTKKKQKRN